MENVVRAQTQFLSDELGTLMTESWVLMPNWKWIALAAALFVCFSLRPFAQFLFKKSKALITSEKQTFLSYLKQQPIEHSASWIFVILLWLAALDALNLIPGLFKYLSLLGQILLTFHVIRFIYTMVDALGLVFAALAAKTESTMDDQLAPFATKTLKVLVVILGILVALQNFGVNVMSLLAGLGLGGLALALAAQDTAANLFGSVTILLDSPFKVGDWIKIGDTEGNVEEIGFRSTRIRTFYNSLVTLPNSVVAKEKIDNMGERPRRRVRQVLGLTYDTSIQKMEAFCDAVRYMLANHEKVDKEGLTVAFNNFNASTLDVLVNFHLNVADNIEEQNVTQKIFLEIMKIAEEIPAEFAFPTQTVYYKNPEPTPSSSI